MTLVSAIGAVVDGVPTTSQTPDSGHRSPVFAVVPIGDLAMAKSPCGARAYALSTRDFQVRVGREHPVRATTGGAPRPPVVFLAVLLIVFPVDEFEFH